MSHDGHMVTMPNIFTISRLHTYILHITYIPEHINVRECIFITSNQDQWDHMSHDSHMVTMPNIYNLAIHSAIMACDGDIHVHIPNT